MAIEFITGKDVERLNDQELRAVLNALLVADAAQHRVPLQDVDISTRSHDNDAGIDARLKFPNGVMHTFLADGENVLQYKAGSLTQALLTEEFMKPGVQTALRRGGRYLFCAGRDYVSKDAKKHAQTLKELCQRKFLRRERRSFLEALWHAGYANILLLLRGQSSKNRSATSLRLRDGRMTIPRCQILSEPTKQEEKQSKGFTRSCSLIRRNKPF